MNTKQFDRLLNELGGENTNRAIHAAPLRDKLAVFLMYARTGRSFTKFVDIHFSGNCLSKLSADTLYSRAAICEYIHEVSNLIWDKLRNKYISLPKTKEDWLNIENCDLE